MNVLWLSVSCLARAAPAATAAAVVAASAVAVVTVVDHNVGFVFWL